MWKFCEEIRMGDGEVRRMEQRVRNFMRPKEEPEERVARPGVAPSFYVAFSLRHTRVHSTERGLVRYSFRVAPGYTDEDGNLCLGAIANLVDEIGGHALQTVDHHTKVSVDISIAYLSSAKLGDELDITARVLGHQGSYSGTIVTLRNKRTGEFVAESRHSLFGNFRSNI